MVGLVDATVIVAGISTLGTVACAFLALASTRREKKNDATREDEKKAMNKKCEEDKQALAQRKEDSLLMLKMLSAIADLTEGMAIGLKAQHFNGELENGLKAVKLAREDYTKFIVETATDQLIK